jgi:membrane-associated phospholipid phosphatase
MSAATITILIDSKLAWIAVLLVPLVGWARVHLNRHTVWQVIIGCIAGWAVTLFAFYIIRLYLAL